MPKIKTRKLLDPWTHRKVGTGVVLDVNAPSDEDWEKIEDPTIKEVDLGNGVYARQIPGFGNKVVGSKELLDAIESTTKGGK